MPVGTTKTNIPGSGTHHIAIQTRDWDASLRLYRDVLGLPVVIFFGSEERPGALLDIGDGSCMELFAPIPGSDTTVPETAPVLIHVAFATTDTEAAVEHVRQAGYEITVEPKIVQIGTIKAAIAFFKGPNGESIEFFQNIED